MEEVHLTCLLPLPLLWCCILAGYRYWVHSFAYLLCVRSSSCVLLSYWRVCMPRCYRVC